MEKFIIHETSNINLLEGQDLVAATILSVAYEIKDQLAILHNELMVSCIDSKDPVAIYCALQLLWSSVDSYKRLQGNQIPDLVSASFPFLSVGFLPNVIRTHSWKISAH